MTIPFFDGHNDLLLRLSRRPEARHALWLEDSGEGHLDLARMRRAGFAGGFFAIFVPSPSSGPPQPLNTACPTRPMHKPLPPLMDHVAAQPTALAMAGILHWMARAAPHDFRSAARQPIIRAAIASGRIAAVLHLEGAEAIGPDLDALHLFHEMGLRSLGPVWSRPTIFGHGVPMAYPGSPDTGPGLTDKGKDLIRLCDEMGILIDLSHLNEKGFDDVARHCPRAAGRHPFQRPCDLPLDPQPDGPAIAHDPRTRRHGGAEFRDLLSAPRRAGGMPHLGWDPMLRHLDHLITHLGEDHVGLGSDFDGCTVPDVIGDVTGVPRLFDAMAAHGYDDALIAKLARENWLACLDRALP
jgi:membrane dipeptidase